MILQQSTVPGGSPAAVRVGGWSESVYSDYPPSAIMEQRFLDLMNARAALLAVTGSITGQRFQAVDPPGVSTTGTRIVPGASGLQCDVPQMALYYRLRSSTTLNTRPLYIRGIPDARVVQGEYSPSQAYTTALNSYLNQLRYWQFRAKDLSLGSAPIFTITDAGVVTVTEAYMPNVNDYVKVSRTVPQLGGFYGGTFRVSAVASTTQFTLANWVAGDTSQGRVSLIGYVYPSVGAPVDETPRVVVKKVGRPFVQYRGRASRRR